MSDLNLKLVIAIAKTYNKIFTRLEKNIQGFGLSISEFGVLEMLLHKGEQPVNKIAEKILVTSGTITYVIDQLSKRDLVIRERCEKDKRVFYVQLTKKGEEFIREIFPQHKEYVDKLFEELDEEKKRVIIDSLFQLNNTIK
jgi:MarR family transcriptional regulator, 2-MHQ and catechol-resistance regulon repressor